jgi:hypothetical protein
MKSTTIAVALLSSILAPSWTVAQNLLVNGDLGTPVIGDVAPTGWTLTESPVPDRDPASLVDFADHTTPGADNRGLWLKPFEGNFPGFPDVLTVDADLYQSVPAIAGQQYMMTGWARFEGGYSGGVDVLDPTSPDGARASLTDTFFALEFLDGLDAVIDDSTIELKANGQLNDNLWKQHTVLGTAPAGTVSVRVRASMVDGEFNADLAPGPGQSAFVDDFGLFAVPEPATWLLGAMSLILSGIVRRSR